MNKQAYFSTLNEALKSEDLLDAWEDASMTPIVYGETRIWTWEDGSRYGHLISIYRSSDGRYERPVHYAR